MFLSGEKLMNFSEDKIAEMRDVIYGVVDKINEWDKEGLKFASMQDHQFQMMKSCGHEMASHDLHKKEIEALEYAVMAMSVLGSKLRPNGSNNGGDGSEQSGQR